MFSIDALLVVSCYHVPHLLAKEILGALIPDCLLRNTCLDLVSTVVSDETEVPVLSNTHKEHGILRTIEHLLILICYSHELLLCLLQCRNVCVGSEHS